MNHFDCKLPIDELFNFLNKPRNIDKDEFMCIVSHMNITHNELLKRIIQDDLYLDDDVVTIVPELFYILERLDFVSSKREMRELIKTGTLFINNIQIKSEKDVVSNFPFLETGFLTDWGFLKFAVIRVGKRSHDIIFKY
jgi:tyrosyl-tRNA synthetase